MKKALLSSATAVGMMITFNAQNGFALDGGPSGPEAVKVTETLTVVQTSDSYLDSYKVSYGCDLAKAKSLHTGWVVGVDGAVMYQPNDKVELRTTAYNPAGGIEFNAKASTKFKNVGFGMGIGVGRQHLFDNRLWLNGEVGLQLNTSRQYKTAFLKDDTGNDQDDTVKSEFLRNYTLNLTGRLGYAATDNLLPYLKVSALRGNFKFTYSSSIDPDLAKVTKTKNIWGFEVGAGLRYAFTEHMALNVEYGYQTFRKYTHDFDLGNNESVAKITPHYHAVIIGLRYQF
jgi:opacity protein-like surface antigen